MIASRTHKFGYPKQRAPQSAARTQNAIARARMRSDAIFLCVVCVKGRDHEPEDGKENAFLPRLLWWQCDRQCDGNALVLLGGLHAKTKGLGSLGSKRF